MQFQVRGDSMHPLIRENDTLHIEPCDAIDIGDVVLTRADRGLTAHRVVAHRGGFVITRGDNAPDEDPAITEERVLGKVAYVLRDGRKRSVSRSAVAKATALVRRLLRPPAEAGG